MAGGSTDCASFILAVNRLYNLNISEKKLIDLGKTLGADVCPCYYNTAVKGEGIGEIITKINTRFKYYIVVIKPKISYSTKNMFKKIDETKHLRKAKTSAPIVRSLETENLELLCGNLYNIFEEVIEEKDIINELKIKLIQNGAMRCINDRFRLMCVWNL